MVLPLASGACRWNKEHLNKHMLRCVYMSVLVRAFPISTLPLTAHSRPMPPDLSGLILSPNHEALSFTIPFRTIRSQFLPVPASPKLFHHLPSRSDLSCPVPFFPILQLSIPPHLCPSHAAPFSSLPFPPRPFIIPSSATRPLMSHTASFSSCSIYLHSPLLHPAQLCLSPLIVRKLATKNSIDKENDF